MLLKVLGGGLLLGALVLAGLLGLVYIIVFLGSKDADKGLERAGSAAAEDHRDLIDRHQQWAAPVGFVPCGCFILGAFSARAFIAAWRHAHGPRLFYVLDLGTRLSYTFLTEFTDGCALATCNTRGAGSLPRPPGDYCQSFPEQPLATLYERHLAAEQFLVGHHDLTLGSLTVSFPELYDQRMQRQVAYVRSLTLWPLRAPWWRLVRKDPLVNRSVEEQIRRGLVAPPHKDQAGRQERTKL